MTSIKTVNMVIKNKVKRSHKNGLNEEITSSFPPRKDIIRLLCNKIETTATNC